MDLTQFEATAWAALEAAAADPQDAFRYLALCTVDAEQRPQARTLVLRQSRSPRRMLTFHTDVRSPKWQEMAANPAVTVLGYCLQRRLQLRLAGRVSYYAAGSDIARQAWQALPQHTRQTYQGGPPGEIPIPANKMPAVHAADSGEPHFGVVILQVTTLEGYQLQRNDNQRALFRYAPDGELKACQWLNP